MNCAPPRSVKKRVNCGRRDQQVKASNLPGITRTPGRRVGLRGRNVTIGHILASVAGARAAARQPYGLSTRRAAGRIKVWTLAHGNGRKTREKVDGRRSWNPGAARFCGVLAHRVGGDPRSSSVHVAGRVSGDRRSSAGAEYGHAAVAKGQSAPAAVGCAPAASAGPMPLPRPDEGLSVAGRRQRIGGAYWTPPSSQSAFRPRGMPSLVWTPTLRSNISP